LLLAGVWLGPLQAQEICGLQTATFDIIFANGFDALPTGLGPALGTVTSPTLGVTPTIAITQPATAPTTVGGMIQVAGTVSGPPDTGVAVNGIRAFVSGGKFLTPPFNVATSTTSLVATATTIDGLTATATLGVTSTAGVPSTSFVTSTPVGFSALPLQFNLTTNVAQVVQTVSVDYGDTTTYSGTTTGYLPIHTYSAPGVYIVNATITFTSGPPQTGSAMVMAMSAAEQRNNLCSAYAYLRAQMAANQVNNALQVFSGDLATKLTPFFQALSTNSEIAAVSAQLGTLATGTIGLDAADLLSVRDVSGQLQGYPVHFVRDASGVWRINGM
jgi:hypothetical protein